MTKLTLKVTLKSDATFGRGDGVAGLVDAEVEHDPATGLPFIRGRVLKGLLVEACADVLYALKYAALPARARFCEQAAFLFGQPGSGAGAGGALHVGRALLPADLRRAVASDIERRRYAVQDVIGSLTAIRSQTAVDDATGAPARASLRAVRVVMRETAFAAALYCASAPDDDALALLDACARTVHRGGLGRNRGRGRLVLRLETPDCPDGLLDRFAFRVRGGVAA